MKAAERRKAIVNLLLSSNEAISGSTLSEKFGVSRQIIVQDITVLKGSGYEILSTHNGYIMQQSPLKERVFKLHHTTDETEDELNLIVDLGGTVVDVFVWHKVSIDALKKDGVDYIIALGHMGVDPISPTKSHDVIANVTGLSAFIDGHSHTELVNEQVKDKDGKEVTLTQTGYYFSGIGKMTISDDGIKTEIIKEYKTRDEAVLTAKNECVQAVEEMLGEKIGELDYKLTTTDKDGNRLVRVDGTNLGEFVADSYYYYVNFVSEIDCDVAIINGGGIRADINPGQVSYKDLKAANPFGNMICAVELNGQQILDMLEWGARATTGNIGEYEEGSFLHTAGLTYTVDTTVISTVQKNDQDIWIGAPTSEYRVKDVKVYDKVAKAFVDLDLTKTYIVAGANYTLTSKGGGFEMLAGKTVKEYIVEDYMALATYAIAFEDTDNNNLSDISSTNSPLRVYENYTLNYEILEGANRVYIKK